MIADVNITEKSYGSKVLMTGVRFVVDDGEKVGIVGRNGVGKSTLFGILSGRDRDYSGEVTYRRGTTVVATAQEHHDVGEQTVLRYVLAGLPEYTELSHIIETHPLTMGDNMRLIDEYTQALERFEQRGFYQIESDIERELGSFGLTGYAHRAFDTLSGGQKRLIEIVKIMHSDAHLALIDEPTNHMDYVAKRQFIEWMRGAREAMLVITHDRDVLAEVDRIIELRDGSCQSFRGNYDAYLRQNTVATGAEMNEYEMIEKRIANLRIKVLDYQRLKEKARNPATIQKFKRLENVSRQEMAELEARERPSFWIDRESVEQLNYKVAGQYEKFKTRNIRMSIRDEQSRSKHILVSASDLALGYDETILFEGVNIDLREGEAVELRGRNGAGKSTLIRALLGLPTRAPRSAPMTGGIESRDDDAQVSTIRTYAGTLSLDPQVRIGVYQQEIAPTYMHLTLHDAIERIYLDRDLTIGETKIRQLMADYLFVESDGQVRVSRLSGGQKARLQLISMLANDPQLLILDEPTNHLDLPSIEELEVALERYSGAILYVSHDEYFRRSLTGAVVQIGAE